MRCSRCKEKMPIKRKRWGFLPLWLFPRRLNLWKYYTSVLCDDCYKLARAKLPYCKGKRPACLAKAGK